MGITRKVRRRRASASTGLGPVRRRAPVDVFPAEPVRNHKRIRRDHDRQKRSAVQNVEARSGRVVLQNVVEQISRRFRVSTAE